MSCSHSCLRNTWCTSTNFKLFSENNNKRTCELNKDAIFPLDVESTDLNYQLGVAFSMFFKVLYYKLIKLHPSIFFLKVNRFSSFAKTKKKCCLWLKSVRREYCLYTFTEVFSKGILRGTCSAKMVCKRLRRLNLEAEPRSVKFCKVPQVLFHLKFGALDVYFFINFTSFLH